MASRFVVSLFVAAFAVSMFLPAAVAATDEPVDDAALTAGDGVDAVAIDRLRSAVASPGPARGGERATGLSTEDVARQTDRDGVLEQPTRAAVYRAILESPGETLSGLADAVGVARSTVRYHAGVLRDAALIDSTEASGALRFAPADADVELAAALNADGTGAVLDAVAEHEPASVTALSEATDRAPSTVSHHLSALEERGLVERERAGEAVVTTLAPNARSAFTAERQVPADD